MDTETQQRQTSSDLSKEAKALAHELKEKIKAGEALDKDAEFLRKKLRICALKLLLVHPNTKEAKDAETHIWIQTSYQFISVYKQRIAALDRKLYSTPAQQAGKESRRPDSSGQGGHVEYRKLLSRFRQFLAEEYKFYVRLLLRFRSQFGLNEVRPHLVRAEIISEDVEEEEAQQQHHPESVADALRFPEETEPYDAAAGERELRLATFAKLLVCLGDIARYREQYSDKGGRPRAGQEEGPPRRAMRGGKNGRMDVGRARNYSRAQTIYEQARSLAPNDGNASHQLAILAAYQKDNFACLLNYYRALCVRQPYDTASDNLNTVLKKALDQYRSEKDRRNEEVGGVPKLRVDRLKAWVVVLHGIWYFDQDRNASQATKHARRVLSEFKSMVSERILPSPLITDFLVLTLSALFKARMVKDKAVRARKEVLEPLITAHILDMIRILLDIGNKELVERSEDAAFQQQQSDLAVRITATLRRMLPAIRVSSKWLRSSINYIASLSSSTDAPLFFVRSVSNFWNAYATFATTLKATFPVDSLPKLERPLDEDIELAGFSSIKQTLLAIAPVSGEGKTDDVSDVHPNEEYLMRILDLLKDGELLASLEKTPISIRGGQYLSESAPDSTIGDVGNVAAPEVAHAQQTAEEDTISDTDDDRHTEKTSRTDDDIVRDAFNVALNGGGDDEDDEQIVWNPKLQSPLAMQRSPAIEATTFSEIPGPGVIGSPQVTTPKQLPIEPPSSRFPPIVLMTQGPAQKPASPAVSGTTALDLLNNVLGGSRTRRDSAPPSNQHYISNLRYNPAVPPINQPAINQISQSQTAAPNQPLSAQGSLPFGPGAFHSPTLKSIWGSTDIPSQTQPQLSPRPLHVQNSLLPSIGEPPMAHYGQGRSILGLSAQHLAPGNERARSLSLSQAHIHQQQHQHTQSSQLSGTQDSIFGSLGLTSNGSALPSGISNSYQSLAQHANLESGFGTGSGMAHLSFEGQGLGQFSRAPGPHPPHPQSQVFQSMGRGLDFLQGASTAAHHTGFSSSHAMLGGASEQGISQQGFIDPAIASMQRSIWNAG